MTANLPPHVLLEGTIKFRDSKKWKSRWAVVCKLSPVADCLHVNLYSSYNDKIRNVLPKRTILLQSTDYLGIESGFTLQNESNTLAIVCRDATLVIALETREIMHQWQTKLQYQFCKEHHFVVHIVSLPAKSTLSCGPARLLLSASSFCLVTGIPPRLLGFWQMEHLRRFGALDGKFCFEGGSKCGKGMGLHVLYSNQADEISKYFELASCGQLHSVNLQTSDCDGYYRKNSRENLLYKYGTIGGGSSNGKSEVHKSNSSDSSSTCDSCSHVLSLTCDETNHCSRSTYYLNQSENGSASKCNSSGQTQQPLSLYHSSINLNCHEQLTLPKGVKMYNYNGGNNCHLFQNQQPSQNNNHQRHASICNANAVDCQCQCNNVSSRCNGSLHRASTISRLSTVKCIHHNFTKTSIHCPLSIADHCHQYSNEHMLPSKVAPSLPSPSDTLKAFSPSTVSLASQCTTNFITSDRESIFSHSSSSSSGCSSLTCGAGDQSGSNGSSGSSSTTHPWNSQSEMDRNVTSLRHISSPAAATDPVQTNHDVGWCASGVKHFCQPPTTDGFISGCSTLSTKASSTNDGSHCEINFIKQRSSETRQMANYDIPRNLCTNLCVNVPFSNQKAVVSEGRGESARSTINHCYCDTAAEATERGKIAEPQTRDQCCAGAFNADSSSKHEATEAVNAGNGNLCPRTNCAHSTLIRRHTKHSQHHFLSASVPDNESAHECSCSSLPQEEQCQNDNGWRNKGDRPQQNGDAQWATTDSSRVPSCSCGQNSAMHESSAPQRIRTQPNYANMQFIDSLELYENLRFTPLLQHEHSSNNKNDRIHSGDSNEERHSIVGDESIISVASDRKESEKQSSADSVSSTSPLRNCPSHQLNRQEDSCALAVPNGTVLGDELLTDLNEGHCKRDAISNTSSKSMNDSHENGNAQCQTASAVPSCEFVLHEEKCTSIAANKDERHCESEMEKGIEIGGCARQNGIHSPTGPSSSTNCQERANNGGHYLRHHHHQWVDGQKLEDDSKNVNISLSSLHNRTSWKLQTATTTEDCHCSTDAVCSCCTVSFSATDKWSESNAIKRTHHLGPCRNRWRKGGRRRRMHHDSITKSYSLEDFGPIKRAPNGCQCSSSSSTSCADKGEQPPLHQLLPLGHMATRQSGRLSCPNLQQLHYCQCSENSAKDFCIRQQHQQQLTAS